MSQSKKILPTKEEVSEKQAIGKKMAQRIMVGQRVVVLKEDGEEVETRVTVYPWETGYGDWVVGLEGFNIAYDITRVRIVWNNLVNAVL